MIRRPALSLFIAVAVAGIALAGCSGAPVSPGASGTPSATGSTASPQNVTAVISQAGKRTTDSRTARFSMTTNVSGTSNGTGTMAMEGIVDFSNNSLQAKTLLGMFGESSEMQLVSVGGAVYVQVPGQQGKWIKSTAGALGAIPEPGKDLANLQSIAGLRAAGTENLDGVETTKYTGAMDLEKALASSQLSDEQRKAMAKQLKGAKAEVVVWLDGEGRVVQITTKGSVIARGKTTEYVSSVRFFDFGVAANITAPPSSDVIDAGDLGNLATQMPGTSK